jgi:hypothetical protein
MYMSRVANKKHLICPSHVRKEKTPLYTILRKGVKTSSNVHRSIQ